MYEAVTAKMLVWNEQMMFCGMAKSFLMQTASRAGS